MQLDFYHVQFAMLDHVKSSMPYVTHQREMERRCERARRQRQKVVIFDCELTAWYKLLAEQVVI